MYDRRGPHSGGKLRAKNWPPEDRPLRIITTVLRLLLFSVWGCFFDERSTERRKRPMRRRATGPYRRGSLSTWVLASLLKRNKDRGRSPPAGVSPAVFKRSSAVFN